MKTFWIAAIALAPFVACGGSGSDTTTSSTTTSTGSGSAGCLDYATAKTGVSFKNDVVPIFQNSCNFSACHSSTSNSPQEDLALGLGKSDQMTDAEVKEVHDRIVNGTAERSSLPLVTAGEPGASWLLAKISYSSFAACQAIADECAPKGCGGRMPQQPLEADKIDIVAGWIKDGAPNN